MPAYPAQSLDKDQAFGALITACHDGSWLGSRDQVAIRLGLMGCRSGDVLGMTWGDLRPDGRFIWMGKGRRQRTITPGPTFPALLARWRRAYEAGIGRPIAPPTPSSAVAPLDVDAPASPAPSPWASPSALSPIYSIVPSSTLPSRC